MFLCTEREAGVEKREDLICGQVPIVKLRIQVALTIKRVKECLLVSKYSNLNIKNICKKL